MRSLITHFLHDEEGATAIEYGIIAGLISIAIVGVLSGTGGLGTKLSDVFSYIKDKLAAIVMT
ncbi:Flp pilus assembly protein, pilin Flp [Variovorax sp. CF313]|jgi:pilus assembly protein Flp/PilA|uniref:Flp family type IVb pilin n=1 Tax=Variovorax sp. CF313 TaxID=1144315 RepID=UPI00027111CA|nr:Flp family type IVb pilin [Variovorax sp. CF313]EJL71675.1 Flp pilus assembly protein, pilin Flp [Variovorax sp. CF313]